MADIYSTVGANARKLVGDGASGAGPYTRFGTPQLQIIEIAGVHSASAVDFTRGAVAANAPNTSSGAYTDANSNLAAAVNALQGFAEVYMIGVPSATEFCAVIHKNTANSGDSTTTTTGYGLMEAAIKAAIKADTSVTITELTLTGDDLS